MQRQVGGRQRASLLKNVAQAPGIHAQDAGIAGNQGIAHIANKPAQIPHGFAHPLVAVAGDIDGGETSRNQNPDISRGLKAFADTAEEASATTALNKGFNGTGKRLLVSGEAIFAPLAGGLDQGLVEEGERRATHKDAVGRAGHDQLSIGAQNPGGLNPALAALKKVDEVVQLAPVGEAVLLLGLTDAREGQGVVQLGADPGASTTRGHRH